MSFSLKSLLSLHASLPIPPVSSAEFASKEGGSAGTASPQALGWPVQQTLAEKTPSIERAGAFIAPEDRAKKFIAHMHRLSRLGANISEAHTLGIFLPDAAVYSQLYGESPRQGLEDGRFSLLASHSLSPQLDPQASFTFGKGLLAWIAEHGKPVHISPFDRASSLLGYYKREVPLKSFLGIPIPLRSISRRSLSQEDYSKKNLSRSEQRYGVLVCDSRKAFAFTSLQEKLLSDLAYEVDQALELYGNSFAPLPLSEKEAHSREEIAEHPLAHWEEFLQKSEVLLRTSPLQRISLQRIRIENMKTLEASCGPSATIRLIDRFHRSSKPLLPSGSPMLLLPGGDQVFLADRMLGKNIESRLSALSSHLSESGQHLIVTVQSLPLEDRGSLKESLEHAIQKSGQLLEQKAFAEDHEEEETLLEPTVLPRESASKNLYLQRAAAWRAKDQKTAQEGKVAGANRSIPSLGALPLKDSPYAYRRA